MSLTSSQIRELKEEKLYRQLYEKYRYFIPNGKAERFINVVGVDEYFITLFSAANGVGKTASSVNVLAHMFWPVGNPYFKGPVFEDFPYPLKKGRIVSDATTIAEAIIPEMKKWFPKDRYVTAKRGKNYEYNWKTDTGFDFDCMTYNQSLSEFESVNLSWAYFDEPPPEAIYKATVSRMRRGGFIFIAATPLMGSAWMYDKIYTKATLNE